MSLLVYKLCQFRHSNYILDHVSFYLPKGNLATLLGPSGSGKSTLLRVIAGLDSLWNGFIWIDGQDHTSTPIQYRRMGFVFQNFTLFSHMNVKENIVFGLDLRMTPSIEIKRRLDALVKALRIEDICNQYPYQLSGGQKQRVALARTLIIEPQILLLDEPFKALDNELRKSISRWLKLYLKKKKITTILVTHDPYEALYLGDEILVLAQGRLVQHAKPELLYDNPVNDFVGNFLGPLIFYNVNLKHKKVILRPYEFQLTTFPQGTYGTIQIRRIRYKRRFIELLFLFKKKTSQTSFLLEIGYGAFKAIPLKNRHQSLYLKIR
jgi:sulfate transport system ATP-binding protein